MYRLIHACTYKTLDRESQETFYKTTLELLIAILRD